MVSVCFLWGASKPVQAEWVREGRKALSVQMGADSHAFDLLAH